MNKITKTFKKIKEFIRALKGNKPEVTIKSSKHGIFCGFKNDYLFKQAIENGTHESHFVEFIDNFLLKILRELNKKYVFMNKKIKYLYF